MFYKITRDITPDYLKELIPEEVGDNMYYDLRNSQDIRLPKLTKNYFFKSFIPSSIKLWNNLGNDIRSVNKVDTFKVNLQQLYGKLETYKPYLSGQTQGHIHLARFRMKLSGLNAHRKKHHFIDHNICPKCDTPHEDIEHFLFSCPAYTAQRQVLIAQLLQVLPHQSDWLNHLETKSNRTKLTKIIVYGTKVEHADTRMFKATASFIEKSLRFESWIIN